jgi:hypothetical protein
MPHRAALFCYTRYICCSAGSARFLEARIRGNACKDDSVSDWA